ncbi:MAG: type III pantothenate kinase [Bacteroidales bacterium]|nr:type III pantothenate kinase [Bacteroidales bacterium]
MTFLAIDIGNTLIKVCLEKELQYFHTFQSINEVLEFITKIKDNTLHAIVCDVKQALTDNLEKAIKQKSKTYINIDSQTNLPVINLYETPNTLGYDRIGAVVGASNIFPGNNCLVISVGTAITYDVITCQNEYIGGAISPGIQLRFKALHNYTGKLPLGKINDLKSFPAKNTLDCIEYGVIQGVISEIEQQIMITQRLINPLKIILTGGDSLFLVKYLKNTIFVEQNLVLKGLINILKHNVL